MLLLLAAASANELELNPWVLGQVWTTVYDQDVQDAADPAGYGDPEDDIGFKVRRARVGVTGAYGENLTYAVSVGMSSGADAFSSSDEDVQIIDAWADVQLTDLISTNFGVTKVPFGRENLMSSAEIPFQDRSVQSNHLAPRRDVGAVFDANGGMWRVRLGAFNGNGSLLGDSDPAVLALARAEAVIGEGDVYETYGTVEGLALGVAGDFALNEEFSTRTLTYGGDVIVRTGGLTAIVEYHRATITPTDATVNAPDVFVQTTRWGGYAQLGYTVGMFQPVVRADIFDEDTTVEDNGDLLHIMAGVSTHLKDDRLRVGAGYQHRMELGGADLPNSTARLWVQFR